MGAPRPTDYAIGWRSAAVTAAFFVGHAFNYGLMFLGNLVLTGGQFGLFYTGILVVTVGVAPSIGMMFAITAHLASIATKHGESEVARLTGRILAQFLRCAAPVAVVLGGFTAIVGFGFGFESWMLWVAIPATVVCLVIPEVLRAAFQSLLWFGWGNGVWIVSQGSQFLCGLAGLLLFGRAWAGILGLLIGGLIASVCFAVRFRLLARQKRAEPIHLLPPRWRQALPLVVNYTLFILFTNVDLVLGFLTLSPAALDVYAASALLPKAIVTASFPIAQVVLPVLVRRRMDGFSSPALTFKAVGLVMGMSAAAASTLWLLIPFFQASQFAIRSLDIGVMHVLLVGAVGLGASRVIIVVEAGARRRATAIAQAICILLMAAVCLGLKLGPGPLAVVYAAVSWLFLAVNLGTAALQDGWIGLGAAPLAARREQP